MTSNRQRCAVGLAILLFAADTAVAASKKKYYLTTTTHTGAQALNACDKKFHMASLFEILDVTSLTYDTARGFSDEDSGSGPPSGEWGWIRTGHFAYNGFDIPSLPNCLAWTTTDGHGTQVSLPVVWGAASSTSPWTAQSIACLTESRVWCVK